MLATRYKNLLFFFFHKYEYYIQLAYKHIFINFFFMNGNEVVWSELNITWWSLCKENFALCISIKNLSKKTKTKNNFSKSRRKIMNLFLLGWVGWIAWIFVIVCIYSAIISVWRFQYKISISILWMYHHQHIG